MDGPLFELLYQCTVRLTVPGGQGTGFFVAPGLILTCAHVVEDAKDNPTRVKARYGGQEFAVESIKLREKPYPDIALLRIDLSGHPCVFLDANVKSGDKLFAFGYTSKYPGGESATVDYEGPARIDNRQWLLKFKGGQIIPGFSGGPLVNMNTWGLCGLIKSTRDEYTDLGGGGIPTEVVLAEFPELTQFQAMFHNWDTRWLQARKQQLDLMAVTEAPLPEITIRVQPAQITVPTAAQAIEPEQLAPRTVLENLFSPLSVDWYADDRIAFGSRDGYLRVIDLSGAVLKNIATPAYPSYVAVHNQEKLAALCYTQLCLVDLATDEVRLAEIDPHADSHVVAWSANGDYLAVAATNTLKIFAADLSLVAEHHVGGKHGARTVAWAGDGTTLYAGIGNGELWRLTEPFDNPSVLMKGASGVLGLRSAQMDDRLACLWQDGKLEIRRDTQVLASMTIDGSDTWASHGPKLAWCLGHTVLACTTSLSNELTFWQFETGAVLACRFERELVALDVNPSDASLVVSVDEQDREDAEIQVIPLANVLAALPGASAAPQTARPDPHLLQADWSPLLEWVEDQRKQIEPSYNLKLDIASLKTQFESYEEAIRKSDAEPEILRTVKRYLKTARQEADEILADVLWIAQQLREAGRSEHDISVVCDRVVSFSANRILGTLGIRPYPQLESLDEFVAFTLGYALDDLLYMGFDASDGRGQTAYVPYAYLETIGKLVSIGGTLGSKYGVKTLRQKVSAGCQLFHDFDYIFDYYEKVELWTRFVLPQALLLSPREQVIVNPSDIERYGLA